MEKVVVVGILQNTIIVADNDEDNMDRENVQGMSDNKRRKLRGLHLIYVFLKFTMAARDVFLLACHVQIL